MGDPSYTKMADEEGPPPRPEPDRGERFQYWFDNFFATNPMAKIYLLCIVNLVFMTFFGICFHISGSQNGDWAENFWMGFTFAADMAEDDHGGPFPYWQEWVFRMMNLTFSFGGAFVFGMVINFLGDAINSRVEGLRQGKSKVIEQGHTLILGWNDRILSLVEQICEANISEGGLPIVILANEDKVGMDEFFWDALPKVGPIDDETGKPKDCTHGSKIVTRGGSPIEPSQLKKVAASYARSIVVLSVGDDPDEADAQSVRVTLALTGGLAVEGMAPSCHIVLELQDVDNADVAMLGVVPPMKPEDTVIPVVSHDIVGKLMIQCAREIGLSRCFKNLLCFAGSECYFKEWPELVGKSFREACYHFAKAAVVGVRYANPHLRPEGNESGRPVQLNPSGDYIFQPGDKLLVLAEDNDSYEFGASNEIPRTPVPPFELPPPPPEKILLCGWRRDFDDLITELDKWVPAGSSLTLLNHHDEEKQKELLAEGGIKDLIHIQNLEYLTGDPCSGKLLERLGPVDIARQKEDPASEPEDDRLGTFRIEAYNSILMLSEEETSEAGMSADSRVMVSMLVMRHLQQARHQAKRVLVSEIRDPRTQELMSLTKCSDSVVGNELVAMILAQISEDRDIGYVMEDLFSEEGMEMHIKDIRLFVAPDELLCWWDLIGRCMIRHMLPIGWIRKQGSDNSNWEAELNPEEKSTRFRWIGLEPPNGDMLIVISED
jgi:hypothetical protein